MCGSGKKARKTPLTHCWATVKLYTLSFHRTIRLCQPCQNLPKGVACQSAQCVRTRQEPGWITGPAWPGAPSCPWTTAQLWTGNKRWEISYKPTDVPKGLKNKQTKKILSLFLKNNLTFITWVKVNLHQVLVNLHPLVQDSFYYYTMKQEGVFWRLAWQHPWESELAATHSSIKTFHF